ncbi:hypothetical protein C5167_049097 [Papaver somniferum]|uniref:GPI-anchored protein LLG1-like domain-containing protein n=1 Tax=Papaver somniferum TaxID=3469 RepID=A0A4Y7KJU2_PAPSO|nr:hypothetical protein C5167_049097 [Papaver somniferum]
MISLNCMDPMDEHSSKQNQFARSGLVGVVEWQEDKAYALKDAAINILARCAVNFEFQNYTIITSQCKGPQYPPKLCCGAFKEFACPFAEDINDLTNDCATTMFSYINLYGKYPPGLFSSECREDKQGLACPDSPLGSSSEGSVSRPFSFPLVLILTVGVLLVFGQL